MNRRSFLCLVLATPFGAPALAADVHRLGFISSSTTKLDSPLLVAFRERLKELGYEEEKNIAVNYGFAQSADELPRIAERMVADGVELIVAAGSEAILAAKNATTRIPIVMANSGDAVRAGFVASLNRPGGNVTGLTQISPELVDKRLEILTEIFPDLKNVGVLWNPNHPNTPVAFQEGTEAATQLSLALISVQATEPQEIAPALARAASEGVKAFLVIRDPMIVRSRDVIVKAFSKLGLAAIFETPDFVEAGGLIAYGADLAELFRRAADYVDRILEGASPAELAVQQPTSFRLVVNQRTARDLGIEIPLALLATADEVVE